MLYTTLVSQLISLGLAGHKKIERNNLTSRHRNQPTALIPLCDKSMITNPTTHYGWPLDLAASEMLALISFLLDSSINIESKKKGWLWKLRMQEASLKKTSQPQLGEARRLSHLRHAQLNTFMSWVS